MSGLPGPPARNELLIGPYALWNRPTMPLSPDMPASGLPPFTGLNRLMASLPRLASCGVAWRDSDRVNRPPGPRGCNDSLKSPCGGWLTAPPLAAEAAGADHLP